MAREWRGYKEEVTCLECVDMGNALLVSPHWKHIYYMLDLFRFFCLCWS